MKYPGIEPGPCSEMPAIKSLSYGKASNFSKSYGTRRSIVVFTRALHGLYNTYKQELLRDAAFLFLPSSIM
jgi:hypothetical protein